VSKVAQRHFYHSRRKNTVARGQRLDRVLHRNRLGVLAFLLSAIEEYSEAPDIPEGSGASSIRTALWSCRCDGCQPLSCMAGVQFFDRPRRREATCCHQNQSLYFRALAGAKSALAPGEHRVGWQPAIRNKQSSPHQMRLCMRPSVHCNPSRRAFRGNKIRE
jgi:hypothetical protein